MEVEMTDSKNEVAGPQYAEPMIQSVLTTLREMIVTGQIASGTRLRAEALATQFNLSRTPIRSALAVLSAEGLVDYSVNRGYTVRAVTISEVFDSIEVRASLESTACRLSVERGWNSDSLARLAEYVSQSRAIVDRGDWSAEIELNWYRLNTKFHYAIHRETHNVVLRNAIRMTLIYPIFGDVARVCPVVAVHIPQRLRQLSSTTPEHIVESQVEHERMLEAIRQSDSAEAGRLMSEHVLATRTRVHLIATLR